jgi:hypothetical protein
MSDVAGHHRTDSGQLFGEGLGGRQSPPQLTDRQDRRLGAQRLLMAVGQRRIDLVEPAAEAGHLAA